MDLRNTPNVTRNVLRAAIALAAFALVGLFSPAPGLAQNQLIFTDGFESGDTSAWSKVRKKRGLDVNNAAAHTGQFGLEIRSGRGKTGLEDKSPRNEDDILIDFFFNPNDVELSEGRSVDILQLIDKSKKTVVVRLLLRQRTQSRFELRLLARANNGRFRFVGSGDARRGEWTRTSFAWVKGGTNGFTDGFVTLSTNGVVRGERTNLNNDDFGIDTTRFGVVRTPSAALTGTFFLDEFSSFRTLAP